MDDLSNAKKTPLFEEHQKLAGKLVNFAGWALPVQYASGVVSEHRATRTAAGLFDVSHMGEVLVEGPESLDLLQYITCNDLKVIGDGKAQYSALLNAQGGVIDDIIIYRFNAERFFVCVNASNAEADFAWMESIKGFNARVTNLSAQYGQIALQGPKAEKIISNISQLAQAATLAYFSFCVLTWEGTELIVARTGYTGEDGFEIFVPCSKTVDLWRALIKAGSADGLVACGLGARDSLRLEACYPLHGHELAPNISALESGLAWIFKPDKGDFIGRDVLLAEKQRGLQRGLVGFVLEENGIARNPYKIFSESGEEIGVVTSGTRTPTVDKALGLALVKAEYCKLGTKIFVEMRDKRLKAVVVKKPFYKRS